MTETALDKARALLDSHVKIAECERAGGTSRERMVNADAAAEIVASLIAERDGIPIYGPATSLVPAAAPKPVTDRAPLGVRFLLDIAQVMLLLALIVALVVTWIQSPPRLAGDWIAAIVCGPVALALLTYTVAHGARRLRRR